ncbi:uncharacterized protein TNCV_3636221 [Trichonephila clavipes]|nr:uncharacterized protein TNCV_3636221 [Trichonephila clavipes]
MDHLEKIFNEVDIPIDGNVLAEMDFGDISNSQWNESFELISENNNFKCKDCKKVYSQQKNLNRHIKTYHSVSSYICAICKRTFNRKDSLRRHQSTTHGCPFVQTTPSTSESSSRIRLHRYSEKENATSTSHSTNDEEKTRPIKLSNSTRKEVFNCFECGKVFYQRNSLNQHVKTVHASSTSFLCPVCNKNCVTVHGLIRHLKIHTTNGEENVPSTSTVNNPRQMEVGNIPLSNSFPLIQSAFKSRIKTLRLDNKDHCLDIKQFLSSKKQDFLNVIINEIQKNELKVNCMLICNYSKASNTGIITDEKNFKTKNNIILTQTNIGELYNSIVDKLLAETADFQEKESGWTLDSIMYLEIRINKFNPLRASLFIDLPEIIKKKHAVINVQNHDNFCFKWAVLSALFPVNDNAHRVQQYETYFNTLDFTGINFPTPLKDIAKFEKVNEISINVYGLNEENKVFPLLITKAEKINMLTCCI